MGSMKPRRSLNGDRRACSRAVAAGPFVLLTLLAAGPLAADSRVSMGFVEGLSSAGGDVEFRVESSDDTAAEVVLHLLHGSPGFDEHRYALELAQRHGRRILVGWQPEGRTVEFALAATGRVVENREREGSVVGRRSPRCLVVAEEVLPSTGCHAIDPSVLAEGLRTYLQGGDAVPEDIATPLFLGALFFQRADEHRQFLSTWVRGLEEAQSHATESLLLALAHPALAELLADAVERAQRPSTVQELEPQRWRRRSRLETALDVVRRGLEGRAMSAPRYRLDAEELRHGQPSLPPSRLLIATADGLRQHSLPPGAAILQHDPDRGALLMRFPDRLFGAGITEALDHVDLDSGNRTAVLRGLCSEIDGAPPGVFVGIRRVYGEARPENPRLGFERELVASVYLPDERRWHTLGLRVASWLPDYNVIRPPWEAEPPRLVYFEGSSLFVATDASGTDFDRLELIPGRLAPAAIRDGA
ncbi:MAG: hypothetical protein MPN21_26265 [Thermoanaerobaculia bacterium]|nr:hypothetical protein [Thermoanaerobaculia bacterium]